MNPDCVLKVDNVSKKFCRSLKKGMLYSGTDLLKGVLGMDIKQRALRDQEFWALKDISFELNRGESIALLGVNGSGKSTLLRLIAGLFPPDAGEITVRGSVASMIAVGAGFHEHMTGRENIFLNAAILGMKKEYVRKVFEEIVDFAEIEDFLDSPVATYSSGMRVRLGFAIASASQPDLLLLDEILAVGDRQFKVKCYNRIAKLKENCAVVFVSHNMNEVQRVTSKALLLDRGSPLFLGDVDEGVTRYLQSSHKQNGSSSFIKNAEFLSLKSIEADTSLLGWKGKLKIKCNIQSDIDFGKCLVRVTFHDETSRDLANWQSKNHKVSYEINKGSNEIVVDIKDISFKTGEYKISLVVSPLDETDYLLVAHEFDSIFINSIPGYASYQL